MNKEILCKLASWRACADGFEYAEEQATIEEAWHNCQRGDWMLWYAQKIGVDLRILTLAKARCAKLVVHLMPDERSKHVVEVAEQFGLGHATREELDKAANDAADAFADTDYADAAGAYAMAIVATDDAAADVVAAITVFINPAKCTDYTDVAAATTVSAAHAKTLAQCADIVRKTITLEMINCETYTR